MNYKNMGQNIRSIRKSKNLTQENLAEAINVSTVFISQIETGVRAPSLETIYNISRALGTTIDELIEGYENPAHYENEKKLRQLLSDFSDSEIQFAVNIAKETLNHIKNNSLT